MLSLIASQMEPDNITVPNVGWGDGNPWQYMFKLKNSSQPQCDLNPPLIKADYPCSDLTQSTAVTTASACAAACCQQPNCVAFVFEPAADVSFGKCVKGKACCVMKSGICTPVPKKDPKFVIQSGVVRQPGTNLADPVIGMRSSPPLGGVSTGSIELRADGSFREWLIFNQGYPARSLMLHL